MNKHARLNSNQDFPLIIIEWILSLDLAYIRDQSYQKQNPRYQETGTTAEM